MNNSPEGSQGDSSLIKDQAQAVEWCKRLLERHPLSAEDLEVLRGRDLACWCATGTPCHADVLLELANPGHQLIQSPDKEAESCA